MKRILITGASGFLGGHLCSQAVSQAQVYGLCHHHSALPPGVTPVRLDLADSGGIAPVLQAVNPDTIIHAAVLQVDECETRPELARLINVEATRVIARWCGGQGRRLVYISSDLVFAGDTGWYVETDVPKPLSVYGATKREGELVTLAHCPQAAVARLPLLYGLPYARGYCFFAGMLERLRQGEEVTVFHDQYRTPGLVGNMAAAVLELAGTGFAGIIHLGGAQRGSRFEFARTLCRIAGFPETLLRPVSMFAVALPAARPRDVSLKNTIAPGLLRTPLLGFEEGLRMLVGH
ncbi:MAG: SDR family oxidoreductase [candidate division KSB1 bacterium]|nr:SDR family oxidoreductase [candidate division KSB1 bacterium]MDZ7275428.1 SDR family oxidoreductase [candidate division KSB1 bacterium]MDZ7286260.1 SDR family oxidoreductase [candidate division KSB1 bacterium]MDZ7296486.1 SDR family oxidoreductase [candidate division KSB1 bacterium]MDZ7305556.1 SDR family oxidoreductase [candidate division KSB1 bacterium]